MLRLNLRVLRPWVNEWVDCFNFLVVDPADQVVDAILNHLDDINHTWDLFELPRMDSNSVVTESFLRACRAREIGRASCRESVEIGVLGDAWCEVVLLIVGNE